MYILQKNTPRSTQCNTLHAGVTLFNCWFYSERERKHSFCKITNAISVFNKTSYFAQSLEEHGPKCMLRNVNITTKQIILKTKTNNYKLSNINVLNLGR